MGQLEEELKKTEAAAKEVAQKKKAEQNQNKPEEKPQETQVTPPVEDDFEKKMFTHLSEKLGREIKSYEDVTIEKEINNTVEKEVRKYNSPEAEAYDKYFEETGRSINDFANLRRDWSKEPEDRVVIDYLKNENPYLTEGDIRDKMDLVYKIPKELNADEYSAEEIAERNKQIKVRNLEWKELVGKARKFHDDSKQKYLTPLEQKMDDINAQIERSKEAWKEGMNKAIPEAIEFGDFKYSVKNVDNYRSTLSSLEGILNKYKNPTGEFDHRKLANVLIVGEQAENILKDYGKHIQASTIESQMQKKSNASTTLETDEPIIKPDNYKKSEQDFLNQIRQQDFRLSVNSKR